MYKPQLRLLFGNKIEIEKEIEIGKNARIALMAKTIKQLASEFVQIVEAFPEIVYAGEPVLRKPCVEVSLKEGLALGIRLGEILLRYRKAVGYGRGLAAPQIGVGKAVFVTFVDETLQTFINPKIKAKSSDTNFYRELCLSSGSMAAEVERPEWIEMEWVDVEGRKHSQKFEGFLARLYQHEEAHLRGVLNIDEACEGGIEFVTFDPLKETLRKSKV